ncbi:hypothetical protein [Sphingobacterium paucimobilis]|uniref:Uncharacterized protein n=1 Tax=Sphingobacterium paucimobilis HER1398 TaxID=1346330 RepID=U2J7J0_9SPHI|nr:hypothetical protein [Sphingobacterium paucimobilis]ERJ60894.1 hypothetical protein M472_19245 [Sphingobacterium paucimobilis HER1398]
MEKLFQKMIAQTIRANDLNEKQHETFLIQQAILQKQEQQMELLQRRIGIMEDLMLKMCEILDRDLLSLLDQPLLFKQDVMEKLKVVDSTYRSYVKEGKLNPMQLGKIDYYFARGLAKDLMASKYKKKS